MLTGFEYRLTGLGWAEMVFTAGEKEVVICFSYLSDPLPDFLTALVTVYNETSLFAHVAFRDEPGETEVLLTNIEDSIRIEVIEEAYFEQLEPDRDERCPMPVFTTYACPYDLKQMVIAGVDKLIKKEGIDGYNEKWSRYAFPEAEMQALAAIK